MELSKKALQLLETMFNETSNLQIPVAVADEVIIIRIWLREQLHGGEEDGGSTNEN